MLKKLVPVLLLALCCLGSAPLVAAEKKPEKPNDAMALNGIKEARGVFLIDFTNPQKTAFYLKIIHGTYRNFVDQGVKPDLVLVFIGETVKYLTTAPDETLQFEFNEQLKSIAESVDKFHEMGVRMEVCSVATEVFNVDNETILPGMTLVRDGFISLIGWQTQGYKLVPIF